MRAVFTYQVLRLLRDKVLLVWTLGLPIVLSLMFMAMFSGLERAYETIPMSFGVVQDEAYHWILHQIFWSQFLFQGARAVSQFLHSFFLRSF